MNDNYLDRQFDQLRSVYILKKPLLKISLTAFVWCIIIIVHIAAAACISENSSSFLINCYTCHEECGLHHQKADDTDGCVYAEIS